MERGLERKRDKEEGGRGDPGKSRKRERNGGKQRDGAERQGRGPQIVDHPLSKGCFLLRQAFRQSDQNGFHPPDPLVATIACENYEGSYFTSHCAPSPTTHSVVVVRVSRRLNKAANNDGGIIDGAAKYSRVLARSLANCRLSSACTSPPGNVICVSRAFSGEPTANGGNITWRRYPSGCALLSFARCIK